MAWSAIPEARERAKKPWRENAFPRVRMRVRSARGGLESYSGHPSARSVAVSPRVARAQGCIRIATRFSVGAPVCELVSRFGGISLCRRPRPFGILGLCWVSSRLPATCVPLSPFSCFRHFLFSFGGGGSMALERPIC